MAATMATTGARDSLTAKALLNYDSFTKKCENYVSANENTAKDIKCFLKALYGSVKEAETADGFSSGETLPELIVDNFDEEQIWQELELQNEARVDLLVGSVSRLVAQKERFAIDTGPSAQNGVQNGADSMGEDEGEEGASDEEDEDDIELEDDEELKDLNRIDLNFDDDDDSDLSMPDLDVGDEDEDEDNDEKIEDEEGESEEEDGGSEDEGKTKKKSKSQAPPSKKRSGFPSEVDDKFFKLSEMEAFLEKQEAEEDDDHSDGDSDESVDLFKDYSSEEDDDDEEDDEDAEGDDEGASQSDKKQMRYSDFFDAPDGETPQDDDEPKTKGKKAGKDKKVKFSFGGEDGDSDLDQGSDSDDSETSDLNVPSKNETKSSYEIRQERLQAKIKKLEEEAVSEKPWQHRGEISGEMRPENALLEEALEFDLTHRPAPVVTEETTQRLEDIIKQRIKDKAWDDVVRKQKPVEAPTEFKKKLVLDQEKSKVSLAQVYEQEYLKQVAAAEPESDRPDEIPKEQVEITTLVDSLFRKLDALSNFHYTPRQIAPEVKIITNVPAINMEEVAPVATSDATLLAPEEVKAKPKGDVKSQGEKTDTDKKRERRQKKKHQQLKAKDRQQREAAVSKLRPGLGNKYSKEKAVKLIENVAKDSNVTLIQNNHAQSLKSSTAFFNQLQDNVSTQISDKANMKKRKNNSKTLSAKRLKL